MYSWEIDNLLKANNYSIECGKMNDIRQQSPQVKEITLLEIATDFIKYAMNTNDGFRWQINCPKVF